MKTKYTAPNSIRSAFIKLANEYTDATVARINAGITLAAWLAAEWNRVKANTEPKSFRDYYAEILSGDAVNGIAEVGTTEAPTRRGFSASHLSRTLLEIDEKSFRVRAPRSDSGKRRNGGETVKEFTAAELTAAFTAAGATSVQIKNALRGLGF